MLRGRSRAMGFLGGVVSERLGGVVEVGDLPSRDAN